MEDLVFHLAMFAAVALTRKMHPQAIDVAGYVETPSDITLRQFLPIVREEFVDVAGRRGEVLFEKVAKDPLTSKRLQERAERYLLSTSRD